MSAYVAGVEWQRAVDVAMVACQIAQVETITAADGTWMDPEQKVGEALRLIETSARAVRAANRRKKRSKGASGQ